MRRSASKSHLLEHKSKKRKRKYHNEQPVDKADRKTVRRALGVWGVARVKGGVPAHRRHKAILDRAKGFRLSKKLLFRPANEAVLHALAYAFRDRRRRKREMRRLWIARINAASRQSGLPHQKLMPRPPHAAGAIRTHMPAAP